MAQSLKKAIEGDETVHYVSSRQSRGKPARKNMQPPMTPMIDVTFQLLIFFLLTISFRTAEGQIPGSLPKKGGVTTGMSDIKPVKIVLTPTGEWNEGVIYEIPGSGTVNGPQKLYAALESKRTSMGDDVQPVIIQARGYVRWKYVVEAFNQAVHAEFKNIGFTTAG